MAAFTEVPSVFSDEAPLTLAVPPSRRQAAQVRSALDICRGTARLLRAHGLAVITELALANDRRADIAGVAASGEIWIVEVKSCLADFRSDQKWPEYREFCDRFFFAVGPDFPREMLPQ